MSVMPPDGCGQTVNDRLPDPIMWKLSVGVYGDVPVKQPEKVLSFLSTVAVKVLRPAVKPFTSRIEQTTDKKYVVVECLTAHEVFVAIDALDSHLQLTRLPRAVELMHANSIDARGNPHLQRRCGNALTAWLEGISTRACGSRMEFGSSTFAATHAIPQTLLAQQRRCAVYVLRHRSKDLMLLRPDGAGQELLRQLHPAAWPLPDDMQLTVHDVNVLSKKLSEVDTPLTCFRNACLIFNTRLVSRWSIGITTASAQETLGSRDAEVLHRLSVLGGPHCPQSWADVRARVDVLSNATAVCGIEQQPRAVFADLEGAATYELTNKAPMLEESDEGDTPFLSVNPGRIDISMDAKNKHSILHAFGLAVVDSGTPLSNPDTREVLTCASAALCMILQFTNEKQQQVLTPIQAVGLLQCARRTRVLSPASVASLTAHLETAAQALSTAVLKTAALSHRGNHFELLALFALTHACSWDQLKFLLDSSKVSEQRHVLLINAMRVLAPLPMTPTRRFETLLNVLKNVVGFTIGDASSLEFADGLHQACRAFMETCTPRLQPEIAYLFKAPRKAPQPLASTAVAAAAAAFAYLSALDKHEALGAAVKQLVVLQQKPKVSVGPFTLLEAAVLLFASTKLPEGDAAHTVLKSAIAILRDAPTKLSGQKHHLYTYFARLVNPDAFADNIGRVCTRDARDSMLSSYFSSLIDACWLVGGPDANQHFSGFQTRVTFLTKAVRCLFRFLDSLPATLAPSATAIVNLVRLNSTSSAKRPRPVLDHAALLKYAEVLLANGLPDAADRVRNRCNEAQHGLAAPGSHDADGDAVTVGQTLSIRAPTTVQSAVFSQFGPRARCVLGRTYGTVLATAAAIANARLPVLLEVEDFLYDGAFVMALCEAAARFGVPTATAWDQNVLVFVQPLSTVDKGAQSKLLWRTAIGLLPKKCSPNRVTIRDNDLKQPTAHDADSLGGERTAHGLPRILQSVYSIENAVLTLRVVNKVFDRERAVIEEFIGCLVTGVWDRSGFSAILRNFDAFGDTDTQLAALSFFNSCCGHPAGLSRMFAACPDLEIPPALEMVDDRVEFFNTVEDVVSDPNKAESFGKLRVRMGLDSKDAWRSLFESVPCPAVPDPAKIMNGERKHLGQLLVEGGTLVFESASSKQGGKNVSAPVLPELLQCTVELLDKSKVPGILLNGKTKLYFATPQARNQWHAFLATVPQIRARIADKVRSSVESQGFFAQCDVVPDAVCLRGKIFIVSSHSHSTNLGHLLQAAQFPGAITDDIKRAVLLVVLRWCRGHTVMKAMMQRGASRMRAGDIVSTPHGRDLFRRIACRGEDVNALGHFQRQYAAADSGERRDIALEALNVFYSRVLDKRSSSRTAPEDLFWDDLCAALDAPGWRPCEHTCPVRFTPWERGNELQCKECNCSTELTSNVIEYIATDPERVAALVSPDFVADSLMAHSSRGVVSIDQAWAAHLELAHLQRSYARVFAEQNSEAIAAAVNPKTTLDRVFIGYVKDLRAEGIAIKASIDAADAHARRNPLHAPKCAAMSGLCGTGNIDAWIEDLGPRTGSDLADDGAARP